MYQDKRKVVMYWHVQTERLPLTCFLEFPSSSRKCMTGGLPGDFLKWVTPSSYFFSKSSKMNFFTSGRRFNFHPAQDSMRTFEYAVSSSANAAKASEANSAKEMSLIL